MRLFKVSVRVALLALLALTPALAGAQTTAGSIAGTVKDATGGVLPGVTIEASSPALIEKTRSVVSDGEGQYKITDLRPGTYSVTFTLPGFNTVKRDGVELTTGFTANISAELKVGSVEETITVSGQTPVVDVQNTKQQAVMSREVLDAIPAGGQVQNMGVLIPGASPSTSTATTGRDVGGLSGQTQVGLVLHGGRMTDQQQQVDGFPTYNWVSLQATTYSFVETDFQEYVFDTGNNSAETESGGIRINLIPREGGNNFKTAFNGNVSPPGLAPQNLDDALKAKGLLVANHIKEQYFVGGSVGGPIMKDKIWFFAAYTQQDNEYYVANSYYNACLTCWTYTEDKSRQAYFNQRVRDVAVRGTWQASPRNKISTFWGANNFLNGHQGIGGTAKEETVNVAHNQDYYYIGTWQSPVTNRLLLELGAAASPQDQPYHWVGEDEGIIPAVAIVDTGLNINYRTGAGGPAFWWNRNAAVRGSVSYVTGSHAIKVGTHIVRGALSRVQREPPDNTSYTALNGVPTAVTYYGFPSRQTNGVVSPQLGLYGQDQWTSKKLTVNAGVRFDYYKSYIYAQDNPATQWAPARNIPEIPGPKWTDLSPRIGVAYDLFGNGKTAIKASVNRYVQAEGIATVQQLNPLQTNQSDSRKWTDSNGDHVVQGNPFNKAANQELGPSTNVKFGTILQTLRIDPNWAVGYNKRPANWEYSASVQQEVIPRVSVNAAFYRRRFVNFAATENQAVSPSDYSPFCVTTPVDSRLPNGGGQQLCGLFDLNANKVGLIDDVRTSASNFGDVNEHWQGFDFTVNARPKNILLQGGFSTGKTVTDVCGAMIGHPNISIATPKTDQVASSLGLTASPRSTAAGTPSVSTSMCHGETPWLTDAKLVASYTLPFAVTVAGTYQDAPGPMLLGTGAFTTAQIQPSLGRAPATQTTLVIGMVPIGQTYVERIHQLDLRFGKSFPVGHGSIKAQFDMYNALNANTITIESSVYGNTSGATSGAAWQIPQGILTARLIKFGVQIDY